MTLASLDAQTNTSISYSSSNTELAQQSLHEDEYYQNSDTAPNHDGNASLATTNHSRKHLASAGKDIELLDKSFRVRNTDYKTFFRVGRVFSTLWSEGMGGGVRNNRNSNSRETFVTEIAFGERAHSAIRYFVVIRQSDRFCTCLPVRLFNSAKKDHLILGDHGIIYSQARPKPIKGITKDPVRIQVARGARGLQDHSLVNYARIYTVETNVKVKDIGELDGDSKAIFLSNFRKVFGFTNEEPVIPVPRTEVFDTGLNDSLVKGNAPCSPLFSTQVETFPYYPPETELVSSYQPLGWGYTETEPYGYGPILYDSSENLSLNFTNSLASFTSSQYPDYPTATIIKPSVTVAEPPNVAGQTDSRFSVIGKPLRFFKIGRVFKTLWTEPAGGTAKDVDPAFYTRVSNHEEFAYSKIRRFVVIRERIHSCLCLPLYTYGGQGTTKSDVRAQDHAIVYALGNQVPLSSDEEKLEKDSFAIIVEEAGEKISPMTRLNFAQVYTIQHNVKVAKVGRIPKDQIERLNQYFVESITET